MTRINDLNLREWKSYGDILTDSLWILGDRDKSGVHNNAYHVNFIPQIPNQLMRRFTKKGDVVLDLFLGHGTTLIESKRLGRHGIGVELIPKVAQTAKYNINREITRTDKVFTDVIVADSTTELAKTKVLSSLGKIEADKAQLIILHPPYHDIIKFSNREEDLCNSPTVEDFASKFGSVIEIFSSLLEKNRCLAIVIGDKYTNSEWVPLGFTLMQETLKQGDNLTLKSILVKNMVNNRPKLSQENLWRYRALAGGFYVFKHEYILIFNKA